MAKQAVQIKAEDPYFNERTRLERLAQSLKTERQSFIPHWRELGEYILPRRPRFLSTDVNKGDRRTQKIIDSTATMAARTLSSGMMGGITNPARPWFRITVQDPDLSEYAPVKRWLHDITERLRSVFLKSNLYNALPTSYDDLGTFGTSAIFMEEDFDSVVRFYVFPIGSYCIYNDDKNRVRGFYREFRCTVEQLIQWFGTTGNKGEVDWSKFSKKIKSLWDAGNRQEWVDVTHFIMQNHNYDPSMLLPRYKKFVSIYYESGFAGSNKEHYDISEDEKNRYLRISGFDYFPIMAPRWSVTGEDVYGTSCPGMICLGDVKALQLMHKRKAQGIEKQINPPMTGPSQLKSQKVSILPGDITYLDVREGQQGFRPTHEVKPELSGILLDIQDHQMRIKKAYFEDLFLMMTQSDRREITAREIDERHEEKMLIIGPVLEQLNQDQNDPLVENTFFAMSRRGMIPTPPNEIQGKDFKVEYISIMAQAQKLLGTSSIERFAGFVGSIVETTQNLELIDKVNQDAMIEVYGDDLSVNPKIIRSAEEVAEIRAEKKKAAEAQRMSDIAATGAKTAKDLSQTDTGKQNALTDLLNQAQAGNAVPTQ